jgi:hypothetical protein
MASAKARSLGGFARVIWEDWGSRVSGGLSVPFTALALFSKADYGKVIWGVLAILGILTTIYQVWSKERKKVVELQSKIDAELNTEADIRGDILIEISAVNPFKDSQMPGSRMRYYCDCSNHGKAPCEIAKSYIEIFPSRGPHFGIPEDIPAQVVEFGRTFRYQNDVYVRGTAPADLRKSRITVYLIDGLGNRYPNTVTRISPRILEEESSPF